MLRKLERKHLKRVSLDSNSYNKKKKELGYMIRKSIWEIWKEFCDGINSTSFVTSRLNRMLSKEIGTRKWIKWAINFFEPYKSAGPDGIFLDLIKTSLS